MLTFNLQSRMAGGELSRRVLDRDAMILMARLGGSTSRIDAAYTPKDEEGQKLDPIDYGYRVHTPAASLVAEWRVAKDWSLTGRMRYAHSMTQPLYGLDESWGHMNWIQASSSVVFRPGPIALSGGLHVQAGGAFKGAFVTPTFGFALRPPPLQPS
ncbi:MAG: hypothetical protein GY884_22815 [Proteobacteria bacterium]|nr:hypothetical protein [Pseudomonadota bacterium]